MTNLDKCKQIIDTESGRILLYRDEVEAVLTAGDTISRRQAIDALISEGRNVDSRYLESERIIHESDAVEAISMLPSAQPELIRCKDCKWKQGAECVRFAEIRVFPDDFCSRAERREE